MDHASARDRKRVGLAVAQCFTVTSKVKSRIVVHNMHALGPAPFRPSFKPLEKGDMLHERTTATDSPSVTPALLLALCLLLARGDAAADPAATPHNACGPRPAP